MIECSWTATHDHGTQAGNRLTVRGICTCPSHGYTLGLTVADEPGDNPRELILAFEAIAPGAENRVEQIETECHVEFEQADAPEYDTITVRGEGGGSIKVNHVA